MNQTNTPKENTTGSKRPRRHYDEEFKKAAVEHSPRLRLAPLCSQPRPRPGVAELGVVRRCSRFLHMTTSIDREGRTALHYAALSNDVPEVRRLLEAGFAPGAVDKSGLTPLHFAAQEYSVDAAALIIQHGAPVDAQDSYGNTPLSKAVFNSRGRGELIRLLREAGAEPRLNNKHGVSPLSLARTIANYDIRQFFSDIPE